MDKSTGARAYNTESASEPAEECELLFEKPGREDGTDYNRECAHGCLGWMGQTGLEWSVVVQTTTRASTKAYAGESERERGGSGKRRTGKITDFTKNHHWKGWVEH